MKTKKAIHYENAKRALGVIMALAIVISILPAGVLVVDVFAADDIPNAENLSHVSDSTLSSLSFSTDKDDVAAHLDSGKKPTKTQPFALNVIPELWMSVHMSATSSIPSSKVYDVSRGANNTPQYTSINRVFPQLPIVGEAGTCSTAFDPSGTGRKNYIAQIICRNTDSSSYGDHTKIDLAVFNGEDDDTQGARIELSLYPFQLRAHNAGAFTSIAAGDYDGDGVDEIAVYSPNYPNSPRVEIYKVDPDANILSLVATKSITGSGGLAYLSSYVSLTDGSYTYDAHMYEYFSVSLATIPAYGNACDALAVASSYLRQAEKTENVSSRGRRETKGADAFLGIWYNPLSGGGTVKVDRLDENWTTYSADKDGSYEFMMFPSVTAGDITNDGIPEVIVAGYRLKEDVRTNLNDRDIDRDRFLITYYTYDGEAANFVRAVPFQWVSFLHSEDELDFRSSLNNNGTTSNDDYARSPLAMTVFAERGPDVNNSVFVSGYVLALPTVDITGQNSNIDEYNSGLYGGYHWTPNDKMGYTAPSETFRIRYYTPLKHLDSVDGGTSRRSIGEAVSGNFISDPRGREQVIFTYINKRSLSSGTGDYFGDLCFLSFEGEQNENVTSPYSNSVVCKTERVMGIQSGSSIVPTSLAGFTIAAPDTDYDSVIMKYDQDTPPDFYFSNPQIVCVLQAAPYFSELEYDGSPDTAMTQTSGVSESSEHAVTVSASTSIGFGIAIDAGFAVVDMNMVSLEISATASVSAGWQHETEWTHSTSSTFSTGSSDSVVLSMTPYVRYHYLQWSPEENDWLPMIVEVPMAPRVTQVSVDTYDRIAAQNNWNTLRDTALRGSVPGDPSTYSNQKPVTWNLYDKGKEGDYAQGGWIPVGTGTGARTQGISHERSSGHGATWSAGIEGTLDMSVFVITGGYSAGIEYTGGYMWSTFNAVDYEGTVPNIPDEYAGMYHYDWEFGTFMVDSFSGGIGTGLDDWLDITDQDELRKLAKEEKLDTLVLGYVVQNVRRPVGTPEPNLLGITPTSVTISWPEIEGNIEYYEVAQVNETGTYILGKVYLDEDGDGIYTFTDVNCSQGRLYQYKVRAYGSAPNSDYPGYGMWSNPVHGITPTQEALDMINGPQNVKLLAGETAEFNVSFKKTPPGIPTYQWQILKNGKWVNLPGETGAALTMQAVTSDMHGTQVRCTVTAKLSDDVYTINSSVAVLSVFTVAAIEVTPETALVNADSTLQLLAAVTGENEPPQDVIWHISGSSGDSTIDQNGLLTVGADETSETLTITATSVADNTKSGTATITVTDEEVEPVVFSVTVQPNPVVVEKGTTQSFEAIVSVQGDASADVIWTVTGNNSHSSVDKNGLLTVWTDESAETLTITATSVFDDSVYGTATVMTTDAPPVEIAPSIQTVTLADGIVGEDYSQNLSADGDGNILWSLESGSLPEGLLLTPSGEISGTPAENGQFTFTLEARNSAGADTKEFTVTVYAFYDIRFDATGGEVTPEAALTDTEGMLGGLPTPTRTNHRFDGWFTEAIGGEEVTEDTVFTGNTTIYAHWTKLHVVTFDARGGQVSQNSALSDAEGRLSRLPTPTRSSYSFNGWFTEATGGEEVTENTVFTEDMTIYAHWTKLHLVEFDANGGRVSPVSNLTDENGQLSVLPTPTRSSYSFNGWFTEETGGNAVTVNTVYTQDTTIYAHWTYTGGSSTGGNTGGGGTGENSTGNSKPGIDITDSDNGTIEAWPKDPKPGDKVNVDVTPDNGYEDNGILVTDKNGNRLPVTKNSDGTYSFVYSGIPVTVTADIRPVETRQWNPFADVNASDWFHDYVKYAWEQELMVGTSDKTFSPAVNATRGMVVTILWRLENEPAPKAKNPFTDMTQNWYIDAVSWASENNIVNGYGNGSYGPEDAITREQLATILYRYSQWKKLDVSAGENTDISSYSDTAQISEYAISAMRWACGSGLINGRTPTTLVPVETSTRAELATILFRFQNR